MVKLQKDVVSLRNENKEKKEIILSQKEALENNQIDINYLKN